MEDPDVRNAKYSNPSHSNLEVVHAYPQPQSSGNFHSHTSSAVEHRDDAYPQQSQRKKLLGLSVPVFWTVVIGLTILLAGAIGGGIGGGLAASRRSSQ